MRPTLDLLLDLVEPVLDHDRPDFPAAGSHTAQRLRASGLVARPADDREVAAAGLLAYATLARARGYAAGPLAEEIEGPLRALLGGEGAAARLAAWHAAGARRRGTPPGHA